MILKKRWLALWQRLGVRGQADAIYRDLVSRYSESHRAYHTLKHIGHCFQELEQVQYMVSGLSLNLNAMELALWYHDAVYDTNNKDNEERSADLAIEMIRNASLSDEFGKSVINLIMATKHLEIPESFDAQLSVDIDLSILGQTEDKFDEYEQQVRAEYLWVSEPSFVDGRSAILNCFLKRPHIYATQFFQNKYETPARENIKRSLERLHNS